MARKTNWSSNGNDYFKTSCTVGKDPDGKSIRKYFYGKSKKEAEAKRDEYLKNIDNGLDYRYKEMVLKDFMKVWLFEVARIKVAPASFSCYESLYRNHIAPSSIAQMKIYEINPMVMQKLYNSMLLQNKSTYTISHLHKLLNTFFNYTIQLGYIVSNPCFRVAIPKDKNVDNDEIDPFTDEEVQLIISKTKERLRFLFTLAFATGLRRGELLGLQLRNINLTSGEVSITHSLKKLRVYKDADNYEREMILDSPKTKSSVRVVPIPSSILPSLEKHIAEQKEKFNKLGIPFTEKSFIFTDPLGSPFEGTNISNAWKRTLKHAGVRYRKLHNTRHTYATKLFEQNVPLKTVQTLLGHATIKITSDVYTHVIPRQKENAVEKINFLFEDI